MKAETDLSVMVMERQRGNNNAAAKEARLHLHHLRSPRRDNPASVLYYRSTIGDRLHLQPFRLPHGPRVAQAGVPLPRKYHRRRHSHGNFDFPHTTKMTAVYRAAGAQGSTLLSAEASELSPTCRHPNARDAYDDCHDCDDAISTGSSSINNVGCWPRPMTTTDEENRNDSLLPNNSRKDTEAMKGTKAVAGAHDDPDGDHRAGIITTSAADTGNAGRGRNRGVDQTPDAITGRAIRKTFKGDIGLALFSPLVLAEDPPDISATARSRSDSELNCGIGIGNGIGSSNTYDEDNARSSYDDEADEEEPVALAEEDAEVLRSSPRLLTPEQMRRIRNEGLHSTAQIMRWHRPYSLSRDGDSFHTMMEKKRRITPHHRSVPHYRRRRAGRVRRYGLEAGRHQHLLRQREGLPVRHKARPIG